MGDRITDIPFEGNNPGGYVQGYKQCDGCNGIIQWNHLPGRPEEFEPPQDECPRCAPDSWPVIAKVNAMWNPFVTDEVYV